MDYLVKLLKQTGIHHISKALISFANIVYNTNVECV